MTDKLHIPASGVPPLPVRKFTVAEYHRMVAAGILIENEPFELLEGWIVAKVKRDPPHCYVQQVLERALREVLPSNWLATRPAITTEESEPEPDLAVVLGPIQRYLKSHPLPTQTALVIEVANVTLDEDRGIKSRVYSRARIPRYWIVNLLDRQVECYSQPTGAASNPQYGRQDIYAATDRLPLIIDGREIAQLPVRDFLP